jgi:Na+/H+-dicarboxylate symporter
MNNPALSATVTVKKRFGDVNLEISARGEAANPIMSLSEWIEDESDLFSANLLKANRHLLGYSRRNGENIVSIKIRESGGQQIFRMVAAIVLGVSFGFIMRTMAPAEAFLWIESNLGSFVTTVFMHALLMMVPPLVFSAIVSGITNMSETADLGKIGARLIGQSMVIMFFTTVLSVGLGYLLFGEDLSHLAVLFKGGGSAAGSFSLKEMLLSIVPENLVDPFRGGNLMQILFLSIFFGIVLNSMGEKARLARELIGFMNSFCLNVMNIVIRVIPLVIFFSMSGLVFHTDISAFLALGKIVLGNAVSLPLCFGLFAVPMAHCRKP